MEKRYGNLGGEFNVFDLSPGQSELHWVTHGDTYLPQSNIGSSIYSSPIVHTELKKSPIRDILKELGRGIAEGWKAARKSYREIWKEEIRRAKERYSK